MALKRYEEGWWNVKYLTIGRYDNYLLLQCNYERGEKPSHLLSDSKNHGDVLQYLASVSKTASQCSVI